MQNADCRHFVLAAGLLASGSPHSSFVIQDSKFRLGEVFLLLYFNWLQKDNPTGTLDRFPKLKEGFETTVPGLYCAGDLTGIPLIKLAAESGHELVERLLRDERFAAERRATRDAGILDLAIVGAGPAGVSASLRAREAQLRQVVIEASRKFNTIVNFPAGKPIYVTPAEPPMRSRLSFSEGTKETLLEELHEDIAGVSLPIREGETVKRIVKERGHFVLESSKNTYRALRVIVAIGKTGNARRLGVPGEKLPKVFTRLIDPGEFEGQDLLVVGGGDSATETAVALAGEGNRVTLSYRKPELSRPKEHNVKAFEQQVAQGRITPLFSSTVKEIREDDVVLETGEGEKVLPNDAVFEMIGTEFPIRFFRRSNIGMEGDRDFAYWVNLVAALSFFTMLYFGKAGLAVDVFGGEGGLLTRLAAYCAAPLTFSGSWALEDHAWYGSLNFVLGWLGSIVFLAAGALSLATILRRPSRYFGSTWATIKYAYLAVAAIFFTWVYFRNVLGRSAVWVEEPTFWYSLLYTTTIVLFGVRRMQVRPTRYIVYQTMTLMAIQTFFLFLLPFYLYDTVLVETLGAESRLMREVFPRGKWSSFGLVLFWPLNIANFGTSTFWTWFPFVQTFGLLLVGVLWWGKGAYCGWVCSCGAMAETLGDEYRTLAPHGPAAKKMDNIGQVVLWWIAIATAFHFGARGATEGTVLADTLWGLYKVSIDVFFAGVLGLGVYFFMGGRVWCRYGCPLAALMHIYTRFSPYRIMANKKRCISCNICTKACHMGIDVMSYASKGVPMNDVQCVRCSACIVNCPMQVLTFGCVGTVDPSNKEYRKRDIVFRKDWTSGLSQGDIRKRIEQEQRASEGAGVNA